MEETKKYEISFILRQDSGTERIAEILARHGTASGKVEFGRIRFPYLLKKEDFGYFSQVLFEGKPEAIAAVSKECASDSNVLRLMIRDASRIRANTGRREGSRAMTFKSGARRRAESKEGALKEIQKMASLEASEAERRKPPAKPVYERELSNEALEKKLEEILK